MSTRIIESGDVRIWTDSRGDDRGTPVLLISGANATAMMWPDPLVDRLAETGRRVIRYDHRDTGLSSKVDFDGSPYSVEDLSRDAVAVLDGLGVSRAHVVGLSLGGTIAQLLAIDHPDRLISMTAMMTAALDVDFATAYRAALVGASVSGGLPGPRVEVLRAFEPPAADQRTELDRRVRQWRLLAGDALPFDDADYRGRERRDTARCGTHVPATNHARATPVALSRASGLRAISIPVLILQAGQDPLNPPPHGKHLADSIPGATLVTIDSLGHALPATLFRVIADTLAAHWRAAEVS
ncbi:alpha/beta fold hydrolase [Roseospira visakhapatnamensis]|uniref:10-carbomethoxy-13-deoxycarminomycin esterase/esterase n=1 Tax=Roseospira visakhapatnamensis TaxID=390880 RepID=A0A7W6W8U2_9PROT|nr:alpha/beta fold hydrolase [Roseospira visakhapatnamensis]MBB4265385.1 10-carbomethoxy-13-deoxycarminomycin esterase/esterase [Roseospira visakhapatnamensis]